MKSSALYLSCTLGLAFTGCTTLFQADFDADAVGALPASQPPGPPAGDGIYSTSLGSTAMLRVLYSPTLGSRALRFGNAGADPKYLGFSPVQASPGARHIYASWKGIAGGAYAPVDLWLSDYHLSPIGGIRLDRGQVRVRRDGVRYETIGTYQPEVLHTVLFTLDRVAGTFSVHFYQGRTTLSRLGLPLETSGPSTALQPNLIFTYFEGGDAAGRYVCDDILISQRDPRKARREPVRP